MKFLVTCLLVGFASPTIAQQKLYASSCTGDLVEILHYSTAPVIRTIPRNPLLGGAQDIAVRPVNGLLCVLDQTFGLPNLVEVDPQTGDTVSAGGCFSWLSFSLSLEAEFDNSLIGEDWMGSGQLMHTGTSLECFTSWGPSTGAPNDGGLAQRRDGTLLASREGSTVLESIDPITGNVTVVANFGIAFGGIEVDTDDTIYGLARDGSLYRVALTPPSITLVATLPAPTPGFCFSDGWSGLAFHYPAYPIGVDTACTANTNSTGAPANLSVDYWPTQPSGTGAGVLGFQLSGMPPHRNGLLFTAPTTGSIPAGNGTLCLGSGLMRVLPVRAADANGTARFRLNLDAVPGHGPAMVGDTLFFQAAFRDLNPTPTIDVSSTLRVMIF